MKLMLGLFLAACLILFLVWKFGISGFSPEEQGAQLQAQVKPGMTWQEVADIHKPGKFRANRVDDDGFTVKGLPAKFDPAQVEIAIKNGLPVGFVFEYFLSGDHHYMVYFDSQGKVTGPVEKVRNIKDLLNP